MNPFFGQIIGKSAKKMILISKKGYGCAVLLLPQTIMMKQKAIKIILVCLLCFGIVMLIATLIRIFTK